MMENNIGPLGIIVILVVIFVLYKLLSTLFLGGKKINDYFCDACILYSFEKNEAAGIAALAAAKTAASVQRVSMAQYAEGLANDMRDQDENISKRLLFLTIKIREKDWSVNDAKETKDLLRTIDKDMLNALNRFDGKYFRKKYASFFKKLGY